MKLIFDKPLIDGLILQTKSIHFQCSDWRLIVEAHCPSGERSQVQSENMQSLNVIWAIIGTTLSCKHDTIRSYQPWRGCIYMGINQIRIKPLCRTVSYRRQSSRNSSFDQITREKKLRSSWIDFKAVRSFYWSEDDGGWALFQAVRWASITNEGWDTFNRMNAKHINDLLLKLKNFSLSRHHRVPYDAPTFKTASGPRNLSRFCERPYVWQKPKVWDSTKWTFESPKNT